MQCESENDNWSNEMYTGDGIDNVVVAAFKVVCDDDR